MAKTALYQHDWVTVFHHIFQPLLLLFPSSHFLHNTALLYSCVCHCTLLTPPRCGEKAAPAMRIPQQPLTFKGDKVFFSNTRCEKNLTNSKWWNTYTSICHQYLSHIHFDHISFYWHLPPKVHTDYIHCIIYKTKPRNSFVFKGE